MNSAPKNRMFSSRKYYLVLTLASTMMTTASLFSAANTHVSINTNYSNNRHPLQAKPYIELPIGAIKPQGWLNEQLLRMSSGMTGNLDTIYEKVMGRRNGWLGGDGDVWERGPYWIDGLLPLAYQLDDKSLIEKVKPWIEWALASQKESGYFGPDTDRDFEEGLQRNNAQDWWPKMVMLKIMQQYYSATGDQRVISFLTNYFKYQLQELPTNPLGKWTFWGAQRGGDNLMVVYWLYNITGDSFLLQLAETIHQQTFNWTDVFLNQDHLMRPYSMHCVNLGQGFKEPVIYYQQNKDPKQLQAVKKAVSDIRKGIGFPTGLWAGDELLRWGNPTQGSELCTAVEMMFSLEKIIEITGDTQWADYLERVAYNALPTQTTANYDARQYYQQINQVMITRKDRNFVTCYNGTDQLMGELTGYPCCTSNMHQGWPKFTQHLWFATADNGVAAMVYAPSKVTLKVGNATEVNINQETNYPFEESVRMTLSFSDKKKKGELFPFHLRIPSWCKAPEVTVNGKSCEGVVAGELFVINREWKSGDCIELSFPMHIEISRWYEQSAVVERGPLVYALKMGEQWDRITNDGKYGTRYGNWYYEVRPTTPWNYCLLEKNIEPSQLATQFVVEKTAKMASFPWTTSEAPIVIKTKARRMKEWQLYNESAGPLPYSSQYQAEMGPEEEIELIPYGCTTLRITEFPVTR